MEGQAGEVLHGGHLHQPVHQDVPEGVLIYLMKLWALSEHFFVMSVVDHKVSVSSILECIVL